MGAMALHCTILALLGAGGSGLPLGIPPLPEDPVLAAVAPEECLGYLAWSGSAAPDPASPNQTEQLLAEPEVQQFLAGLKSQLGGAVRNAAPQDSPQAAVAGDVMELVGMLLTHPAAAFVSSVKIERGAPDIRGGAILALGDDTMRAGKLLMKYEKMLPPGAVSTVKIEGTTFHRVQLDPKAPAIVWGAHKGCLVAGVGEGSLEAMLQRWDARLVSGTLRVPPKWFTAIGRQLPVARRSSVMYLNVKAILDLALQQAPDPKVRAVLRSLGLDKITTLSAVSGMDKEGCVSRTLLGIDGQPTGLLAALTSKPLTAKQIAAVPADATAAICLSLDVHEVFQAVRRTVAEVEPQAAAAMDGGLEGLKAQIGIDLEEDLLKSLGNAWRLYVSPGEGNFYVSGLTLVVDVKDRAKLLQVQEKIVALTQGGADRPRRGGPPQVARSTCAGQTIYWLQSRRPEDFVMPVAWCFTDSELVVALVPHNIKAYLTRGKDFRSLAEAPALAEAFQGDNPPLAITYLDTPALIRLFYPLLQLGAYPMAVGLEQAGVRFDPLLLPSLPCIMRHLRPDVSVVRRTAEGIECTSTQSVGGAGIAAAAPVGVALLLPAVQSAREAARRVQSMNNLKQIDLALLNHEAAMKAFPPAYKADAGGKPLLSWRVLILPYIDQEPLYRQFHLDEPWDSPHNKQLIPMMPQIYRAPQSQAAPGMTNYLTIRGQHTLFPGANGIQMAEVRDGASNTIAIVEAADSKAVIWTKPDDFEPDPKNPMNGLVGLQRGVFLVGMADGSVRSLPASIPPDILGRLFNRDDGWPIPWETLDESTTPRAKRPAAAKIRANPPGEWKIERGKEAVPRWDDRKPSEVKESRDVPKFGAPPKDDRPADDRKATEPPIREERKEDARK